MIAKMSQKMRHTSSTLKILGIAWTNALTTTYNHEIHLSINLYNISTININLK